MLTNNLLKWNNFFIKLFKVNKLSFFYIQYYHFIYKYLIDIFLLIQKHYSIFYNNFNKLSINFTFKNLYFNKKSYFNSFIFKDFKEIGSVNLTNNTPNVNSYIIQKNFTFYYHWHFLRNDLIVVGFNLKKLFKTFYGFKIILFSFFFYNVKVLAWGTKEFEAETNATNEYFTIKNIAPFDLYFFIKKNIFIENVTYNLKIYFFMKNFSNAINRNAVFISLQDSGHGSFIIHRFRYFSIGCFTNLKIKHSYSFLIPIHIRTNFAKMFMFSFIFSYKSIANKYQLLFFNLYFFKYKLLLKLILAFITQR